MILQRQGYNECQLATIAMLADAPLASVRATANALAYTGEWADVTRRRVAEFWDVVRLVQDLYGLQELAEIESTGRRRYFGALATGRGKEFPRNSKGECVVRCGHFNHVVAYECDAAGNVTIFDPEFDKPVRLEDYVDRKNICFVSPFKKV